MKTNLIIGCGASRRDLVGRAIGAALCSALLLAAGTASAVDKKKGDQEREREEARRRAATRVSVPAAGTVLPSTPAKAVGFAMVNFKTAAAADAAKPAATGPRIPVIIPEGIEPAEPNVTLPAGVKPYVAPAAIRPMAASPAPAITFTGVDDEAKVGTSFIVIPPDTDGAVGPNHVFTTVNNNYRITDKTGVEASKVSMDTFWTSTGGTGFFDPKTLYDPVSSRWIVVAVSDAGAANSSIEVGVSQTNDPTGSWNLYRFDVDATNTNWSDFPTVGYTQGMVAVNVNMFANVGNAYAGSQMLLVDYANMKSGVVSPTASFATGTGFCTSPVGTYDSAQTTLYAPTHLSSAGGTFRLDTVTGTAASPTYTVGATKSRGLTWVQPSGQILPQTTPLAGASACGGTPCPMEVQDAQIRTTSTLRGSAIYYTQTVGLPSGGPITHTAVQWTKIDLTGAVLDGGRIEDPTATTSSGFWYSYPDIAVNAFGDIIVAFTQHTATGFASSGYAVHLSTDGAGVMNSPFIYLTGLDYYHKDFGSGRNRWGDYARAQLDPSNNDLWVITEYAKARTGTDDGGTGSNSSRWGTEWARVSAPTPVGLTKFVAN